MTQLNMSLKQSHGHREQTGRLPGGGGGGRDEIGG